MNTYADEKKLKRVPYIKGTVLRGKHIFDVTMSRMFNNPLNALYCKKFASLRGTRSLSKFKGKILLLIIFAINK